MSHVDRARWLIPLGWSAMGPVSQCPAMERAAALPLLVQIPAAVVGIRRPALLPALALMTGAFSLLRDDLRIDPTRMIEDQGGLTPEQQAAIRDLATATLVAFRDAGSVVATPPDIEDLERVLEFMAGGVPS